MAEGLAVGPPDPSLAPPLNVPLPLLSIVMVPTLKLPSFVIMTTV